VLHLGVLAHRRFQAPAQARRGQREHLVHQVPSATLGQGALALDVRTVLGQRLRQLFHALAVGRLGRENGYVPVGLRPELKDSPDLAEHRVGQRVIGLVDDDHVGDLHDPRLQRLDRVARARLEHEDDGVGVIDDVDLGLADADGFDEHVVLAGGVHQQGGLQRRLREPAQSTAVGHRADEHARVEEVLRQADAVAQQRAACEGRRRVDRKHGDVAPGRALGLRQRADQRGLADARRPGEADHRRPPGARKDLAHEVPSRGVVVLHEGDPARQRAFVALYQPFCKIRVDRHGRGIIAPVGH
jgi:hypothetical protein